VTFSASEREGKIKLVTNPIKMQSMARLSSHWKSLPYRIKNLLLGTGSIDRAEFALVGIVLNQWFGLLVENSQAFSDRCIVVVCSTIGLGSLEKPCDKDFVRHLQL
jgi:hypothetical protein